MASRQHFLIDPPSPFAPLADWQEFLSELQEAVREFGPLLELQDAIAEAEKAIRDKS